MRNTSTAKRFVATVKSFALHALLLMTIKEHVKEIIIIIIIIRRRRRRRTV